MTISFWKQLLTKPQCRNETGKVLVEGKNLVLDLLKKNLVETLILTEKWENITGAPDIVRISTSQYQAFSRLDNPEGVAAIVALPTPKPLAQAQKVLILDRLQDPGNVGTLIRTAVAFGIDHVALILPSCDPWNEKVVRAGKGAHFSISIGTYTFEEIDAWQKATKATLFIADLQGDSPDILKQCTSPFGIVLGNEAEGTDNRFTEIGTKVSIAISPEIDSLNVAQAGAIFLYLCKTV